MESTLHNFFYPLKTLIVGASSKKGSIGYELTSTILKYGYKGNLFLVNPSSDSILGLQCFKSVSDVTEQIDLAIILVPKSFVEESIENCLNKGIKSFILITAGFKETGAEGEIAERRILEKVQKAGARLVGPNCMGVINTLPYTHLNATFVAEHPESGNSAFLSQSGALGAAVLNSLRETGITFAHFISVGNKADISENDMIEYWNKNPDINVITMYLESFSNGRKFLEIISGEKVTKPLIVIKAGRTAAGQKAASSHTGALGSSDRSVDAVFKQFGVIRADNINELFDTSKGFEFFRVPSGRRVAVVTNAGGPAILAVDQIGQNDLSLSELSDETRIELRKIVHPEGSVNNPVDLLPGGTAEMYQKVIEILIKDNQVDSVIAIFVEPVMVKPIEVVKTINSIKSEKPVFTVVMPLPEFWSAYKQEISGCKPLFRNPEDPAIIIKNMLKYRSLERGQKRLSASNTKKMHLSESGFLSQEQVIKLAKEYKIPLVQSRILLKEKINTVDSGFPYVLKAGGKNIIHKSELKGVELNIRSKEELKTAAENMRRNFNNSDLDIEYFILQPQLNAKYEILIGGFTDPDFGPMVMFGTGGKYVEYYKDVSVRSALLSEIDVINIIDETVMGRLIRGVRGEAESCLQEVKSALISTAQLLLDYPEISEIDLNPLIIDNNNNLLTVDIRIKVK